MTCTARGGAPDQHGGDDRTQRVQINVGPPGGATESQQERKILIFFKVTMVKC